MTEKKHTSKGKWNRNQKYYEDIIAFMPGHVYWKDKNGAFLGCNLQQAKDAGFNSPDEIIGKTDYEMPWSIQADYLRDIDLRVMESGQVLALEELCELPDGTKRIYLSNKLPLYDENNQVSGILGISFDITDRKKLEVDLIKAKELAETANRAKTEFLENMRHDMRTPLTGITGFAELIKKEAQNPRIDEYADNLVAASNMLLEFLNEILEAIKVVSGDTPIVRRKFSLHDMVNKIIQLMKPKALEKGLSINLHYDKSISKYIIGDYKRIQRILLELISNALNFTHEGHVTVCIDLVGKRDGEPIIKFLVQDTGIGIPGDKLEEIFLRFKRLIPSYKGIYKGVGLGLSIVKQFVDDIGGEIYCTSQLEKGTEFTCLFSLKESLRDNDDDAVSSDDLICEHEKIFSQLVNKNQATEAPIGGKARILLVEDQVLAAKVAESIISSLDCSVDLAQDGKAALSKYNENTYDLIFMDVGLPDISGNDLTKQIRMNEWKLDRYVPIIALTAHIDSENKQSCLGSGMDAVLSKPLTLNTAKDIINAFIPTRKIESDSKDKIAIESKEKLLTLTGDYIDVADSIAKVNGDIEVAKEMLVLLIKDFYEELPLLKKAKANDDWVTIQKIVHKQRGGACYCGTPRFLQACAHLEEYLLAKKTEWRDDLYKQFVMEMDKICEMKNILMDM